MLSPKRSKYRKAHKGRIHGLAKGGTVSDWQGGAFDKLLGGCKLGVELDAKGEAAPAGDALSSDPAVRALKPKVREFLLGYSR